MMQHFGSVERMHVELDHEKQDWLYSNGTDIPKKYKDTVPENICEELRSEHNQAGVSYLISLFHPEHNK